MTNYPPAVQGKVDPRRFGAMGLGAIKAGPPVDFNYLEGEEPDGYLSADVYRFGEADIPSVNAPTPKTPLEIKSEQAQIARDQYAKEIGARPERPQEKWWQRLAAGAVGGMAGYVNAAGRMRRPIDAGPAVEEIRAPGYQRRLADWQARVEGAGAQAQLRDKEVADLRTQRKMEGEETERKARTRSLNANAAAIENEGKQKPKDDYISIPGGGLFNAKTRQWERQPVDKTQVTQVDPEMAKLRGLIPADDGNYYIPNQAMGSFLSSQKPEEKKTPNEIQLILDADNPDPAISGPAKKALARLTQQKIASRPVTNFMNSDAGKQAIEEAAQSLAKGDLTPLRQVASLRGDQRLQIFTRARQINPNFNTAEIDRKIKMEDAFTNGKDGKNLESFGIFLQHAGAASEAVNSLRQTDAKLLNRPLNWWRTNVSGDPAFMSFAAALEPVRKEFEGFLLGGRALYADDRRQAEIILNENSSPAQIQAALTRMGHTAKARVEEMNNRYRRVMGKDLYGDILSAEALEGAKRIGVPLDMVNRQSTTANTSGGTVDMRAPDGSVQSVPADQVEHFKKLGAVVVGGK